MKLLIAQGNLVDPARKYDGSQDCLLYTSDAADE